MSFFTMFGIWILHHALLDCTCIHVVQSFVPSLSFHVVIEPTTTRLKAWCSTDWANGVAVWGYYVKHTCTTHVLHYFVLTQIIFQIANFNRLSVVSTECCATRTVSIIQLPAKHNAPVLFNFVFYIQEWHVARILRQHQIVFWVHSLTFPLNLLWIKQDKRIAKISNTLVSQESATNCIQLWSWK